MSEMIKLDGIWMNKKHLVSCLPEKFGPCEGPSLLAGDVSNEPRGWQLVFTFVNGKTIYGDSDFNDEASATQFLDNLMSKLDDSSTL